MLRTLCGLACIAIASALVVSPHLSHIHQSAHTHHTVLCSRLRCQRLVCQEEVSQPAEASAAPARELQSGQVDLVERASDPFRVIRVVMYVTFGVSGIAGCAIAISQMGKDPAQSMSNLAVNAAVLAGGVGIFFFDRERSVVE